MTRKLYQHLASRFQAMENCLKSRNVEWYDRHHVAINAMCADHLPRGSGFDGATTFNLEASKPESLVFTTSFHHMNEGGYYDGWTNHEVIVTPSLMSGFNLRITGRNRNDIKDYIAEVFGAALGRDIDDAKLEVSNG